MSSPYTSVVYLALGGRRTRAARWHASKLAAAGTRVLLVVADRAEWADGVDIPGVTVRKLGSAELRPTLMAARRFLLARRGPLAGAGLLVAGDPEAMPIADAARRRFPRLSVRCEPVADPDRRPAPADLAVITPWYPSPGDPFAGAFVQAATAAVCADAGRVTTLHTENWFFPPKGVPGKLVGVAVEREIARHAGVAVEDTAEGELTRVVTPQVTNGNYALWAREQIKRLRAALPTGRIEAPLVHAHTGHYAGVVAVALARPDARIVVTEHATFLDRVFKNRASRRQYGGMLQRVNRVLCVGRGLYDQIAAQFPQHLDKLQILPNPIDFDRFVVRPVPSPEPLRWLYVGRLLEHKGVRTLLDGFAQIAGEEPRARLTLVGSGQLEKELRERIAELGLTERVSLRPPVAPEEVAGLMHEHDVLTHASTSETFGMTVVEAVATGTPVMAARSQGPSETLHDLDGVAGVLFDVTDDPAVVAAAYRRLRAEWAGLDLSDARERLRARYGREAVGARLLEVYREVALEPPAVAPDAAPPQLPPAPAPGADRIAVVAINPPSVGHTRRYIDAARARGYAIDLVTLDAGGWGSYRQDPGIRLHGIGGPESRHLGRRLERGLMTTLPRRTLGYLRARSRKLPSPVPEALVITAQRAHAVLAERFHGKVYDPVYQIVRPRILWRIAQRRVLPVLERDRIRRVVVHGVAGVTIGWGLAKDDPAVPVGTDLTPPADDARVHTPG